MLSLFAHHAEAMFNVEVFGRDFPGDGMTEHAIFAAVAITMIVLMSYGTYAGVRDYLSWKRKPIEVKS